MHNFNTDFHSQTGFVKVQTNACNLRQIVACSQWDCQRHIQRDVLTCHQHLRSSWHAKYLDQHMSVSQEH